MGISGISMQTCKCDPNNDIQILEVAQKQAVLCGFIFLSWFSIFGATATKDKLSPAQTPEMKKLTSASVGKNNVMGVGDELSSGMKIVHSRGNLSCHIISEIISLLPASPSEALLQWLPYCNLSKRNMLASSFICLCNFCIVLVRECVLITLCTLQIAIDTCDNIFASV